jgi:hypothetical protein
MVKKKQSQDIIIYQAKNGAIELRGDFSRETIWASLQQIADLFETDKSGISRHIKNIYEIHELERSGTVAIFATVQKEGSREISREIEFYNLDMILSVGYRVNSAKATIFRRWATDILRGHIVDGYTINRKRIGANYTQFLKAVEDIKQLLPEGDLVATGDAIELVRMFATTWLSLDAYDRSDFPTSGVTRKQVSFTADELASALDDLKGELVAKKEASDLFGTARMSDSVSGIIGNVFQSFGGKDLYVSAEEKAAHLLYFVVKNHPFLDGNKRSGAFAFVWFLKRAKLLDPARLSPEALTALTLLVAESKTGDKDRIIGLTLLLLRR